MKKGWRKRDVPTHELVITWKCVVLSCRIEQDGQSGSPSISSQVNHGKRSMLSQVALRKGGRYGGCILGKKKLLHLARIKRSSTRKGHKNPLTSAKSASRYLWKMLKRALLAYSRGELGRHE